MYSVKWGFQWLTRVSIGFAPTVMLWMIYLLKALESIPSKLLCYARSESVPQPPSPHTVIDIRLSSSIGGYGPVLGPGGWSVALYAASWLTFDEVRRRRSSDIARGE